MLLLLLDSAVAALRFPFWPRAPPAPRTLYLLQGDLCEIAADAIVTSANPQLEGTRRANHWKFAGRTGVDAAVRAAGGPALDGAAAALAARAAPLPTASATATAAGGALKARWVVHSVAPAADEARGRELLAETYAAALVAAENAGARSVALPAIGTGVAGFSAEAAAEAAFGEVQRWLERSDGGALRRVDCVVFADNVMACWEERAAEVLGEPDGDEGGVRWWTATAGGGGGWDDGARAEAEQALFGGGDFVPGIGTMGVMDG